MYSIKQNGIQEKFLKISMMVAAIAALAIGELAVATPMLTGTAHADFGSIHGRSHTLTGARLMVSLTIPPCTSL